MQFVIARKMNAKRPYRIDAEGVSSEVVSLSGSESGSRKHDAFAWGSADGSAVVAHCPRPAPFRKMEWRIVLNGKLELVGTLQRQTWKEFFAFKCLAIEWQGAFHATQQSLWTQYGGSVRDISGRLLLAWRRGRNLHAVCRGNTSRDLLLGSAMIISQISGELDVSSG